MRIRFYTLLRLLYMIGTNLAFFILFYSTRTVQYL